MLEQKSVILQLNSSTMCAEWLISSLEFSQIVL